MSSAAAVVGVMPKDATKQQKRNNAAAATVAVPLIDNRLIPKPLQVRPGEPCSIAVNISGLPPPIIRWQIGRRRVKESSKYQLTTDGRLGHTLVIARATEDLEQGVWVVASNEHGEDCCHIEVNILKALNEDEMSGIRNRRPPVASTPEMKQKTSILRKKKTRRVGETQSVASLDAWTAGTTTGGSKRLPSVDDVTTAPDNSLVAPPSDLNQSLDSETIISGRRRTRTGPKQTRFSSTDAIYSGAPLSLTPGRQDSYSSVTTVDVMVQVTDRGADDSTFQGIGTETHPAEEGATTTKKKKKGSVRKKTSGSRSSLASNSDASNGKNREAKNMEENAKNTEENVKNTEENVKNTEENVKNTEENAKNTEEIVMEQLTTIDLEEKISSAKEMVGSSIPLETTEDGKLLWELFGMRLNQLCKKLLTNLQSNLDAEHMEETETVESEVDGDQSSEPSLVGGQGLQPQWQQQQQKETSVDDEEEIIRHMVDSRQIPITDMDDFDRDENEEEEEPPLLIKAQQNDTRVDDDVKENPPTLATGKVSGWKTAPVQESGDDIPDAQSLTRPTKENTASAVEGDADKTKANGVIPSIAIYDVQGSMVKPSANESQKRKSHKTNTQERKLEKAQQTIKEAEVKESYERKPEKREPADKKETEVKEPEKKESEINEPFRKEPEKKESEINEPFRKESVKKGPFTQEHFTREPQKKEPVRKEADKKESEIKEPLKTESQKRESQKREPETKEPLRKEPEKKEPVRKEPEKKEPETKESLRKEPEKKEPFRKEPEKTEPEKKDPEKKEPEEKEPVRIEQEKQEPKTKEPFRKEPEKKELERKVPEKKLPEKEEPVRKESVTKEPVTKEPEKIEPFRKAPVIIDPVRKEPVVKEPVRKEPEKKEPEKIEPRRKEPAIKEPGKRDPDRDQAIADKPKDQHLSGLKPLTPGQLNQSPISETKIDTHRIQEKPPTGKKHPSSPEDDLKTTKAVVHQGYRPQPRPRKLSSSGGSDSAEHAGDGPDRTEEGPPVSAPRSPLGRDAGLHSGGDSISYSWQRERTEESDGRPPDSIQKSTADNNCPIALTTYIIHSGSKSRQTPAAGERPVNQGLDGTDGTSLKDTRSTLVNKPPVSATGPEADPKRQRSSPAPAAPIVPERPGRKTADNRVNTEATLRQRSQSADRVDTRQDSDRRMMVVDIDIDDQQDSSRAGLYRGSSNLYRSASGDLNTLQGATGTTAATEDLPPRRPPVPKPRQRVSLKPARSEESLATRSSGSASGRTNKVDGSDRRFLRGAKSVESLSATGSDSSFVSRMGRRTMSQEWQFVTVTTTTEEVVVIEQAKDKKESNQRPDLVSKEVKDYQRTDLVSKEVKDDQRNKSNQRTDILSKVKEDRRNKGNQRTDLVSKEVKDDQRNKSNQRPDLVSKEVKDYQRTDLVSKDVKDDQRNKSNQRTDLVSKEVKDDQRNKSNQRTDILSKVKEDRRNKSNQRTDLVSKEVKDDQRTDLVSKEVKDNQKTEGSPVSTGRDQATGTVERKDKQKESNEEISRGLVEQRSNDVSKEAKDEDLSDRPSEVNRDSEKQNDEQPVRAKEEKPSQLPKDIDIIGSEEQTKQGINETGSQTVDDSQNMQEKEQPHLQQGSRETLEDATDIVEVAQMGTDKAVAAIVQVLEETVNTPTYITSATIFLKSPKLKDDSGKANRYLDTASKPPIRPRLSSQDTSTQTDEDTVETETQTNTDLTGRHKEDVESDKDNRKKETLDDSETKHISTAVVYEYGEIISFYLDPGSGLNVEPPTPDLERIRLEPGEPVTALVTDNTNVIVLSAATDRTRDRDNDGEKDNTGTTALLNRNLRTTHDRSRATTEEDVEKSQPTTISPGSDDAAHGSEPIESFIALRSSRPGTVFPKTKETNAEHYRFSDSAAGYIFPALTQSTATTHAIENQPNVSTNRPPSEISSSEQEEIGRTAEVLLQQDEHHLISFQSAADERGQDSDQSDEESRQSSVSSAPSCDTVIRVAIKDPSSEALNETLTDCVQSALPTSSAVQSDPITSPGDGTDDDEVSELDSAITFQQVDTRLGQGQDQGRQNEEEEMGAVGGIAAAFKEDESFGARRRDDARGGNEAWPRRPAPDRPRAEPTDHEMDEKTFVQCALSSLGTIIFLAVAAIIFHFLNNIVGDQLE